MGIQFSGLGQSGYLRARQPVQFAGKNKSAGDQGKQLDRLHKAMQPKPDAILKKPVRKKPSEESVRQVLEKTYEIGGSQFTGKQILRNVEEATRLRKQRSSSFLQKLFRRNQTQPEKCSLSDLAVGKKGLLYSIELTPQLLQLVDALEALDQNNLVSVQRSNYYFSEFEIDNCEGAKSHVVGNGAINLPYEITLTPEGGSALK